MLNFFDFSREELEVYLTENFALPKFRATQLFEWVYRRGARDFSQMSNISAALRAKFAECFALNAAEIKSRQVSCDGTRKYLLEVGKNSQVETVMIKQPTRMTLCVSSQVGCGMGCTFCRTGEMGFVRNLKTNEIINQVLLVKEDAKNFDDDFNNIVFMGMGEPLHNFKEVTRALRILTDVYGLAIPPRKITISSVGLVPAIQRFAKLDLGINLAISLNATTDRVRSEIMPINKAYPIEVLINTLKELKLGPRKKITIEYVMLAGVNDSAEDLRRLPKLLENIPSKINLIPYNENAGLGFKSPSKEKVHTWYRVLNARDLNVTIRWSKGADINAACGQLAVQAKKNADVEQLRVAV